MLHRTLRLLSVVLIAALLYGGHCYATCGAATPGSSASSPCPHHEKNHSSGTACPYQHSDLFSPAAAMDVAGLANVHCGSIAGFMFVMRAVQTLNDQLGPEILQDAARHASGGSSVLALLSMFRI